MKAWPIVIVCQSTGAVHTQLSHNYGAEAFLLQYKHFVSIRGTPKQVVSDKGSQLTSAAITVTASQDPMNWNWKEVEASSNRMGTEWSFVPAGCQYRNGLAESRVKILKSTLSHTFTGSNLSYAELSTALSRAANIANDRPIGVRNLTEDDFSPITPNQLLLGRTSTVPVETVDQGEENLHGRAEYQAELLKLWWQQYIKQVFSSLLPFQRFRDARRQDNLQVGDVCLLKYDSKVKANYRLCRISEVLPDVHNVVRTVRVKLPARDTRDKLLPYKSKAPVILETGVQRLCLICPKEDILNE